LAALATGLKVLATDGDLARRLGEAGRQRIERLFHIRRMAEKYHRHFLELLKRRGPPLEPSTADSFGRTADPCLSGRGALDAALVHHE
jgi:hypothetical protein